MLRPVTVYAEMTPNPATMKFVADVMLVERGEMVEFLTKEEAKGNSKLAEELFDFPFVTGVFISNNFVSVSKTEALQWPYLKEELRGFIQDWLRNNEIAVDHIPEVREVKNDKGEVTGVVSDEPQFTSDTDRAIFELLEEYVRPAVEGDGGAIFFKSFEPESGRVTVVLKGACSGCPSASATLKMGVESLLKTHIPDVKEVVALED